MPTCIQCLYFKRLISTAVIGSRLTSQKHIIYELFIFVHWNSYLHFLNILSQITSQLIRTKRVGCLCNDWTSGRYASIAPSKYFLVYILALWSLMSQSCFSVQLSVRDHQPFSFIYVHSVLLLTLVSVKYCFSEVNVKVTGCASFQRLRLCLASGRTHELEDKSGQAGKLCL